MWRDLQQLLGVKAAVLQRTTEVEVGKENILILWELHVSEDWNSAICFNDCLNIFVLLMVMWIIDYLDVLFYVIYSVFLSVWVKLAGLSNLPSIMSML